MYSFVCLALQEITNILKCLASVVHIFGNISFGAINQQSNSAFVKDPQPAHCGKVLSLLITIEYIALLTAVTIHTRPSTIFFSFEKLSFSGRQSNVSMTIVVFISCQCHSHVRLSLDQV